MQEGSRSGAVAQAEAVAVPLMELLSQPSPCQRPGSLLQLLHQGSSEAEEQFMQSGIHDKVAGTLVNTSIFVQVPRWLRSGAVAVKSALVVPCSHHALTTCPAPHRAHSGQSLPLLTRFLQGNVLPRLLPLLQHCCLQRAAPTLSFL